MPTRSTSSPPQAPRHSRRPRETESSTVVNLSIDARQCHVEVCLPLHGTRERNAGCQPDRLQHTTTLLATSISMLVSKGAVAALVAPLWVNIVPADRAVTDALDFHRRMRGAEGDN